jgi:hypothetical protein
MAHCYGSKAGILYEGGWAASLVFITALYMSLWLYATVAICTERRQMQTLVSGLSILALALVRRPALRPHRRQQTGVGA